MISVKTNKDIIFKQFWRDNARFADVFNAVFFDGEKVISADMLSEMDTDVSGTVKTKHHTSEYLSRRRDIVRKISCGVEFVIAGIEDQMHIHYGMPLRNMIYDGMGYLKEYRELSRRKKKNFKNSAEFLSKLSKGEKLHPILTLTIYYGEDVWDGPVRLREMVSDMPKQMEAVFSDYKMNMLQLIQSENYKFDNEDVRTAFDVSRNIMNGQTEKILETYRDRVMNPEVMAFIGAATDMPEAFYEYCGEEEGNMCRGLEQFRHEGWLEGRQEGLQKGRQEGLQEGRQKGLQEGQQEGQQQGIRFVVTNMLRKEMPVDMIISVTDMTKEEVEAIRRELEDGQA